MTAPEVESLRRLLMLLAKAAGNDETVDRVADMGAEKLAALASDDGATTFASEHQDGDEWETGGRYYKREGGETRRVANPNAPDEGDTEGASEPAAAAPKAPEQPKVAEQPKAVAPAEPADGSIDEPDWAGDAGDLAYVHATDYAATLLALGNPTLGRALAGGVRQYIAGERDLGKILDDQFGQLARDVGRGKVLPYVLDYAATLLAYGNPTIGRAISGGVQQYAAGERDTEKIVRDQVRRVVLDVAKRKLKRKIEG